MCQSIVSCFGHGLVAVGGSRQLGTAGQAVLADLAVAIAGSGRSVGVGCCIGADAAVITALSGSQTLYVFAAFGPVSPPWAARHHSAPGAWSGSALAAVATAVAAGSRVHWWAGGDVTVPLAARLSQRTRTLARAAAGGALIAFASPGCLAVGSLLLARQVACRGLPVIGLAHGFSPALLPLLGAGQWSPVAGNTALWVSQ